MSIRLPLDRTRSFTHPLPAVTTITSPSKTLLSRTINPTLLLVPMPAVLQTQSYPIGTLISSLHSHSITHHSHLPKKSWQCLPNPVQSVISKRPNINQQRPPSPPI